MAEMVAAVLFVGITAYAIFGGADFGAGFWDLVAGSPEKGARPRSVVNHSIGPVWEANHVWLIFILVVLWTAFSEAFASIMLTLFVPLSLAALGIVLRGSSFAFRKEVTRVSSQRNFGAAFAISSVLVPFCFGAVAGAIASGRVPAGGVAGDRWSSWLNPTSILGGVLAVVACAFLAAVYMVWDAHRFAGPDMVEYFRRRAIVMAIVAGVIAIIGVFVLNADAEYVFDRLTGVALPLVIVSALCGLGSLALLIRHNHRFARFLAIGAVATVIWAWGVAQWPYLLPETLKVTSSAAPDATLASVLVVFALAALICLPSLGLLYYLDQRSLLDSEGPEPGTSASPGVG
jgi:cytochrome d ubiquinol oxidase subunit II